MTKVSLFPWLGVDIKTAATCEIMQEQSGFLTGSTFLPWVSSIIPGDECTSFIEPFEVYCGEYALKHTESFEDSCGNYTLQYEEGWEN